MATRLYVFFEDKEEKPAPKYIVPDYTMILMCGFISIFVLYGFFSTHLMDFISAHLESNVAAEWVNTVANRLKIATTACVQTMVEIIKGVLYLLLVAVIWFIGRVVMFATRKQNDDKPVFAGKHLCVVMNRSIFVTAVFFLTYAMVGDSSLDSYVATAFLNFVGGTYISIGNFQERHKDNGIETLPQEHKTNRQINLVFACCLLAIPIVLLLDYIATRFVLGFSIVWVIILIMMVTFCIIDGYDRREINKMILMRTESGNVLIYGKAAYGTLLQNKVYRSVRKKCSSERVAPEWISNREYHMIIIVDPFGNEAKWRFLSEIAREQLAPGGIIIAPSYTSDRRKSTQLSHEAYKAKLEGLGFQIKKEFRSKFHKITYIEMNCGE